MVPTRAPVTAWLALRITTTKMAITSTMAQFEGILLYGAAGEGARARKDRKAAGRLGLPAATQVAVANEREAG